MKRERISQSPGLHFSQSDPRRLKTARWWAVAWGVFLLTLTSWPQPPRLPIVSGIPNFDKLVHFVLYAVEAVLLYRALARPGSSRMSPPRALAVLGIMAVWGVLDEIHQIWIPGRSAEVSDVAADVFGSAVGALTALLRERRTERQVAS